MLQKNATYSESSNPELSTAVLGSRIGPVIWQIAGPETTPLPHRQAEFGNTPSGRGLKGL